MIMMVVVVVLNTPDFTNLQAHVSLYFPKDDSLIFNQISNF